MANREIEYRFKIEAFSPETIAMLRLGEYLAEFGKLLANVASVHFRRLEGGSTTAVAGVEYEASPKVKSRLLSIKRSEAPKDAAESYARLNTMLREDNAVGRVLAINDGQFTEELYLPGKEIPIPAQIGPFTEPATIKAELHRIGGRDETAHAQLMDSAGRLWNGKLTKEQAARMDAAGGGGLYKWFTVSGNARWVRTEESEWKLIDFHILDFKLLPEDSLEQDIESLRGIHGSKWGEIDDPDAFIRKSRAADDGIH